MVVTHNVSTPRARRNALVGLGFSEAEADALVTTAAPSAQFRIRPNGEEAPLGSSKLAGLPDLSNGTQWPELPAYGLTFDHLSGGYEAIIPQVRRAAPSTIAAGAKNPESPRLDF